MKLEYNGYILEIKKVGFYFETKCNEPDLSLMNGRWRDTLDYIVSRFEKYVDDTLAKKMRTFEYKGYLLKLGLIEDSNGQMCKWCHCEALEYKAYGEDEEANITKFKKYINWKISEEKKQKVPNSLERIEKKLDKLVSIFAREKTSNKFEKRFYQVYEDHPIATHGEYPNLVRELLDELKKLEENRE